ncbi:MAG TPA: nuclear transport factor 2 family protein, partial [Gemmata sp.]|nr:nuclear transport factor 2 family protein [Gemmata sp.]
KAKDDAAVDHIAADGYLYVAPNGIVMDRAAILRVIRSPSYRLDHGSRSEVSVRMLGRDAAIVRFRWRGGGSFEGTTFTDDQIGLMICERQAGAWRIVMEQCSFGGT